VLKLKGETAFAWPPARIRTAERRVSEHRKNAETSDRSLALAHPRRRREARYTKPIAIEVSGIGRNGKPFHERTFTTNVSGEGCGFTTSVELKADDIVALTVTLQKSDASTQTRQSLFQIMRVMREATGWLVGAWKIDSGDFWGSDLAEIAAKDTVPLDTPTSAQTDQGKWPEDES
jgi:hypothetical protein